MPSFDADHMRRVKQMLTAKIKLEPSEAALLLADHWVIGPLSPGDVLSNLSVAQIQGFLEATAVDNDNARLLKDALYIYAESVSARFFGDKVYQRGTDTPCFARRPRIHRQSDRTWSI